MTQKVEILVGIPGSGKSTYAKNLMLQEPGKWKRINNDSLREAIDFSEWSKENEKIIVELRKHMIRDFLKKGFNLIIDNLNINKKHFDDVVEIAQSVNSDIEILEKAFYIELDEAIARDSKREGKAKVGESIIKKWWKDSGRESFKAYKPRSFIVNKRNVQSSTSNVIHNPDLDNIVMCDLDGTLALLNGRDPYNASLCENDLPNAPVIETLKSLYLRGYQIVFCSGREDKYKQQTINFIEKYLFIVSDSVESQWKKDIPYKLFMRKTRDFRKDSIVKEEMYRGFIENKYNVLLVLDDRTQVVNKWRSLGLTCFQVAPGDF